MPPAHRHVEVGLVQKRCCADAHRKAVASQLALSKLMQLSIERVKELGRSGIVASPAASISNETAPPKLTSPVRSQSVGQVCHSPADGTMLGQCLRQGFTNNDSLDDAVALSGTGRCCYAFRAY